MGFIVAIMCNAVINMYYRPIEDEVKQRFEQIEDMIINNDNKFIDIKAFSRDNNK